MLNNRFSISLQCGEVNSYWAVEHTDCNLDELYSAFKGLLVTQGFSEESINRYLKELYDEIED